MPVTTPIHHQRPKLGLYGFKAPWTSLPFALLAGFP
jgi:hypothetical protein